MPKATSTRPSVTSQTLSLSVSLALLLSTYVQPKQKTWQAVHFRRHDRKQSKGERQTHTGDNEAPSPREGWETGIKTIRKRLMERCRESESERREGGERGCEAEVSVGLDWRGVEATRFWNKLSAKDERCSLLNRCLRDNQERIRKWS